MLIEQTCNKLIVQIIDLDVIRYQGSVKKVNIFPFDSLQLCRGLSPVHLMGIGIIGANRAGRPCAQLHNNIHVTVRSKQLNTRYKTVCVEKNRVETCRKSVVRLQSYDSY